MDPNNGNLYDSYGEFLLEENRHEEALTKFLTALKMEPDEWFVPYTKVNIASIYVHLEDRENAEKYLNDAKIVITRCACSLHKRDELIKQVEKVREQIKNKQE
jgi:Tfp pilus assembly protein PilF